MSTTMRFWNNVPEAKAAIAANKNSFFNFCRKNGISTEKIIQLDRIGGHKIYHLEGSALDHTILVWLAVQKLQKGEGGKACPMLEKAGLLAQKLAVLHDIAKLEGVCHGEDDWEYPNHSVIGSMPEYLSQFCPSESKNRSMMWLIRNHMRALFWKNSQELASWWKVEGSKLPDSAKEILNPQMLAEFSMADIQGSFPVDQEGWNRDYNRLKTLDEFQY